jgi:hypothetical protein
MANAPLLLRVNEKIQQLNIMQQTSEDIYPLGSVPGADAPPLSHRWRQSNWRCSTGMCCAGWTKELANDGTEWLTGSASHSYSNVVLLPEDIDSMPYARDVREELKAGSHTWGWWNRTRELNVPIREGVAEDRRVMAVSDYARIVLGLGRMDAETIFSGTNRAEEIDTFLTNAAAGRSLYGSSE